MFYIAKLKEPKDSEDEQILNALKFVTELSETGQEYYDKVTNQLNQVLQSTDVTEYESLFQHVIEVLTQKEEDNELMDLIEKEGLWSIE